MHIRMHIKFPSLPSPSSLLPQVPSSCMVISSMAEAGRSLLYSSLPRREMAEVLFREVVRLTPPPRDLRREK